MRNRIVLGGLAFATVLALAAAVWTGLQVRDQREQTAAAAEALAAGRAAATAFTSYDYRHLDQDLTRVANTSTGTFRTQFTAAMGELTDAITKAKGVSTGKVTYAGLVSQSASKATVLAAVDASISNTASAKPSTRRYRLTITLDHSSGEWLISQIAPVS